MGFSVSASYTSVTISYSGGGSGWTYDFSCGSSTRTTSSSSATFSGLSEGTTYSWSGVAMNENGVPVEWDSGDITTDQHAPSYDPETNATISLSLGNVGNSVVVDISNLARSVSYRRKVTLSAVADGSSLAHTWTENIAAGTSNPDFSHTFSNLSYDTTYTVTADIYAYPYPQMPDLEIKVRTIQDRITTGSAPPASTVLIYNGSQWVEAVPYIYNGTAWKEADVKIYDGNGWKPS